MRKIYCFGKKCCAAILFGCSCVRRKVLCNVKERAETALSCVWFYILICGIFVKFPLIIWKFAAVPLNAFLFTMVSGAM